MPRFPLKLFFKDRLILASLILSLTLNLIIWVYLGFSIKPTAETVFLHYTIHFGVDLAGPWSNIFFLPLLGFILILINFFLAYFIYDREKYLSFLLSLCTFAIQIFLLVEGVFLAYLNH